MKNKFTIGFSTCRNCKFVHEEKKGLYHECRRYPPQIISEVLTNGAGNIATDLLTEWPVVYKEEWCGEWEEKK